MDPTEDALWNGSITINLLETDPVDVPLLEGNLKLTVQEQGQVGVFEFGNRGGAVRIGVRSADADKLVAAAIHYQATAAPASGAANARALDVERYGMRAEGEASVLLEVGLAPGGAIRLRLPRKLAESLRDNLARLTAPPAA